MTSICEWRLGRKVIQPVRGSIVKVEDTVISLEEIVAILKRIRKSVRFWRKKAGRRGYLEYIDQFIP